MPKLVELAPVHESSEYYEQIAKEIARLFRDEIYKPLMEELGGGSKLENSTTDALIEAIRVGRVTFYRGVFSGKFGSKIVRELRKLGAKFDRVTGTYRIPARKLGPEINHAILASEARMAKVAFNIQKRIAELVPEKIAEKFMGQEIFDKMLWKVDRDIRSTMKSISVPATLTPEARAKLAKDYTQNLRLDIKEWTDREVIKLREEMEVSTMQGMRYEEMVNKIRRRYGVSESKAKFLARQETGLLVAKFKELRYKDAGITQYKWMCVAGSKNHPVRPSHKKLEGKIFSWDDPPITSEPGEPIRRNNPKQDYNCRCFALPVVKF